MDNGRLLGSGTSRLPITWISGRMHQRQDGVMGGDVRRGNLEWKRPTTAPASSLFFFFFRRHRRASPAAVITQPNPLGGLSRLKSRKIVQLSGLLAGEGVGRVKWGGWGEHWDCVLLGHIVFIPHNSLSQGYFGRTLLMTKIKEKLEERQALIFRLSLLCILEYFNPPPQKKNHMVKRIIIKIIK